MKQLLLFFLFVMMLPLLSPAQTGCTSVQACNYDATAITDDGSCYGNGDFDCNYQIDVLDYLIFMQHVGCPTTDNSLPTNAIRCDLDGNGNVTVADLILLIAYLGYTYTPN